jgi:hypothetical protein
MKIFLSYALASSILLFFIAFFATGGHIIDSFNYRVFGTINEQSRNQIFHESQAYNDSMLRELFNDQKQYNQTTDVNQKQSILALAHHDASVFPRASVPPELLNFYDLAMNSGG